MNELSVYHATLWCWLGLSAVTFVALLFLSAPYGRHARGGWGPTIAPRWGWLIMEAPASLVIAALALPWLVAHGTPQTWLLLALWELHYVNRAFVFPFRLRSTRPMPLSVVAMGVVFNLMNGWLNGRALTIFGLELGPAPLTSPRVIAGAALFLAGLSINWDADARLLRLRARGGDYAIPTGGFYRFVSSPNYLGEMIEWTGFALAAGSFAALVFVVWTAANLVPRALQHHRWYKERFPDYPRERRAIIPFVL